MNDEIVNEIVKQYWKQLKKLPNVIGFSGQLQPRKIDKTGEVLKQQLCFRIYVVKKVDLPLSQSIPRKLEINGKKLGFQSPKITIGVDVWGIGRIKAQLDTRQKHRPLISGVSANHYSGGACTGNVFWRDKKTGKIFYSSNNHCFARENTASIGDAILQPSPLDGGNYRDKIGELVEYVPIKFDSYNCRFRNFTHRIFKFIVGTRPNKVDIAFSSINVQYKITTLVGEIHGKTLPHINEAVWKIGRTTGLTNGVVIDLDWNGYIEYLRGTSWYEDNILIQGDKFSQPGDSGSPVFVTRNSKNLYIGALLAGSDNTSVVCKVSNIELIAGKELVVSQA